MNAEDVKPGQRIKFQHNSAPDDPTNGVIGTVGEQDPVDLLFGTWPVTFDNGLEGAVFPDEMTEVVNA